MRKPARLLFFYILIVSCRPPEVQIPVVVVTSVADGDTFTMISGDNNENIRVRLYGIDAPEKGQDFANVSKTFLKQLLTDAEIKVLKVDEDQYERVVAIVFADGVNVNEALLQAGLVWHYEQFDDSAEWSALEEQARAQRKGLWAETDPIPPWDFRKAKRKHTEKTF